MRYRNFPFWTALTLHIMGCAGDEQRSHHPASESGQRSSTTAVLRLLPPDSSGVRFINAIEESEELNYYTYEYMYNGGGVATGDVNGDGLPDLYFTANLSGDRLYINRGHLRFEDVTARALPKGIGGWHTGVTMADVNNDGRLDIYVCRAGRDADPSSRTNLYFENQGNDADQVPSFRERAEELGIADTTRSTQGTFFDHDRDGDLDLYVINFPLKGRSTLTSKQVQDLVDARKAPTSRLFRNDGARFTDVTHAAGLSTMGYSLGVSISDLDNDGSPDIYVANDYIEPDKLWMSDGRGHYANEIRERTRHISNFGMGCDAADYNNDGNIDVAVLDMVSEDHVRSKMNMGAMSSEKFWMTVLAGYHYQYMFNTLQLNNGNGTFSEVGQLAGMSKTDWSWAPLFCDLDNDGWKDLLITNGFKRDMRDNDYMAEARRIEQSQEPTTFAKMLALVPSTRIRSYLYHNNGDLTFSNVSEEWGLTQATNDNGAAYADLDADGDLDLVINNIDEVASIYENTSVQAGRGHWLRIALEGAGGAKAMGARVTVRTKGLAQVQELMPTRGYQSSVEPILHFGLGAAERAEEIEVRWPDGMITRMADVAADRIVQVPSSAKRPQEPAKRAVPLFAEVSGDRGLTFMHREDPYDDFQQEVLLPHAQSRNGPLLGTGDVNGDGLEDLFVGGAHGQPGALFLQAPNGTFAEAATQPWEAHRESEDMGSLFFDADADGDRDLLVLSGSNETTLSYELYNERLYLNDGKGRFSHANGAIPATETSAHRASAADIDGDGDQDLFLGGRVLPGAYPKAPRSYLLLNDGQGRFSDATAELAPHLTAPGLVTDPEFVDYDGDGDPDLVTVGEWMPIGFHENNGGRFTDATAKSGLKDTEGWWWSLTVGDVDGDRDPDLICGNIGWNNKFHCSPQHPLHLYWNDFDGNGHGDIVLAKENDRLGLVPVRGRECSSQQCAMIKEKFKTYGAFANASLEQIYTPELIGQALHLTAKHLHSCVLLNQGGGHFTLSNLPNEAQVAPIMGSALSDVNGDGHVDLIVAGNHWGAEVETIRYDAGTGLVLLGNGKGAFTPMSIAESGFFAWNDVRDLTVIRTGPKKTPLIIVANNNDRLQAFGPSRTNTSLAYRP